MNFFEILPVIFCSNCNFIGQPSTLKLWANTRWDSRWKSIDAIINNFSAIIQALDDISEEGSGSRSINVGGLLIHVQKSIFIITTFILHKLLGLIKILSDHLKSKIFVILPRLQRLLCLFFSSYKFRLCKW